MQRTESISYGRLGYFGAAEQAADYAFSFAASLGGMCQSWRMMVLFCPTYAWRARNGGGGDGGYMTVTHAQLKSAHAVCAMPPLKPGRTRQSTCLGSAVVRVSWRENLKGGIRRRFRMLDRWCVDGGMHPKREHVMGSACSGKGVGMARADRHGL